MKRRGWSELGKALSRLKRFGLLTLCLLALAGCEPSADDSATSASRGGGVALDKKTSEEKATAKHGRSLRPAQKEPEDRYPRHQHPGKLPVLGPVTPDVSETDLDPPSDDEIVALIEKRKKSGLPKVTIELIADYVDPPRTFPIVGLAQWHHIHYKCIAVGENAASSSAMKSPDDTVVVYIDHDHLHMTELDKDRSPDGATADPASGTQTQSEPHGHSK